MNISAIVLAKNNEKTIGKTLASLSFCDEIVVIDDESGDATRDIAKKAGAKVFIHPLNNDFSAQRNFGLGKASGEWVLFVDSDEVVSQKLAKEIGGVVSSKQLVVRGFYVRRVDHMWGGILKYGETGNIQLLRLARKNAGKWQGKVHERWIVGKGSKGTEGTDETKVLRNSLDHYPHQTIAEFLKEINYYTDIRVRELYDQGIRASFFSILAYPKAKFFMNYIIKQGFRDGTAGMVHAILMSFHSFLVRGKLYLKNAELRMEQSN